MEQRKVEREKWGEKSVVRKVGARKMGCEKWGEENGA